MFYCIYSIIFSHTNEQTEMGLEAQNYQKTGQGVKRTGLGEEGPPILGFGHQGGTELTQNMRGSKGLNPY
jgi:hypothetical protein